MEQTPPDVIYQIDHSAIGEATASQINGWIRTLAHYADAHEDRIRLLESKRTILGHVEGAREALAAEHPQVSAMRAQIEADRANKHRLTIALADEQRRHAVTQAQLDKFMSACADQSIQIMEHRGNADTFRRASDRIAELEAEIRRTRAHVADSVDTYNTAVHAFDALRAHIPNADALDWPDLIKAAIEHINAPCEDCRALAAQLDAVTPAAERATPIPDGDSNDIGF